MLLFELQLQVKTHSVYRLLVSGMETQPADQLWVLTSGRWRTCLLQWMVGRCGSI